MVWRVFEGLEPRTSLWPANLGGRAMAIVSVWDSAM